MKESWPEGIDFLFQEEGYSSNLEHDPGGPTFLGISSIMWPVDYRKVTGLWKSGDKEGALQAARDFYQNHFWRMIDGDNLPYPLDVCAFDCAVNQGVGEAERLPKSTHNWRDFLFMREQRYADNVQWVQFGHGWTNRVLALWARYYGKEP